MSRGRTAAAINLLSIGSFLGLWQLVVWALGIPNYLLPTPWEIILSILRDRALLADHLRVTLIETSVGLALATGVGLLVAAFMYRFKFSGEVIYPYLVLSQAIPLIAIAPLILIWFGLGITAKIIIVSFVCFFPIGVNAYEGFRNVDKGMLDLMETMDASRWQKYRHLIIPASLPGIFAGLKIAATYSVLGAVIGEWLGGVKGMGIYMTRALTSFQTDKLFGAIVLVMLASFAFFKLVDWVSARVTPWTKEEGKYVQRESK
ncbi:MAG: ABC transporter permease [Candidatus Bipolaricaulota bacterium]